jgi:hypothetical protein
VNISPARTFLEIVAADRGTTQTRLFGIMEDCVWLKRVQGALRDSFLQCVRPGLISE